MTKLFLRWQTRSISSKQLLWALPWLVLALGFGTTYVLWRNARLDAAQDLEEETQFWMHKVIYSIEYRLKGNVQLLRGIIGLFEASKYVSRQDFQVYVQALHLEKRYPGIQGVGFAVVVPPEQKAAHTAALRAEGFPNYAIYPDGERDLYTAIIYLEPFSGRNLRAFSYDMFSEPVRHAAMARARDENQATLTGKVTLVQETDTDIQAGFLVYTPIYRHGAPHDTLEERRANLIGWAYSPVRMDNMLHSILGTVEFGALESMFDVEIYDGVTLSSDTLMFDADQKLNFADTRSAFHAAQRIDFGGHHWSVFLNSKPAFDARLHNEKSRLIAITGSIGSLLLALLIGILTFSQARIAAALQEAARANEQLMASAQRFRSIFETSVVGIVTCGPDLRFTQINQAFCKLLEYTEAEVVGLLSAANITYPDDLASAQLLMEKIMRRDIDRFVIENRYITQTGRMFNAITAARAIYDDAGCFSSITVAILDITERKQAEEALRTSLEEKNVLLKEVHHRVKNNLQIINSLLSLQTDHSQTPEVLDTLRDMQNRVQSMALLHETLYQSSNFAQISLPNYVENLCIHLWRAMGSTTGRIELERQIDAVGLPLDQAVPCGLIINELVSNALKHAFPAGRGGRVRVTIQAQPDQRLALIVADDGVGLPPRADPRCAETLGLQLVFMLVEQLRGTLVVTRDTGTAFQIALPIKAG
ncbi:MAG: CHASE domain-containing protein [Candidatus Competibacteraceae bacterium]|nr:CHASE domain-containing protein [Candidatus Competibacteraceae bacterium]